MFAWWHSRQPREPQGCFPAPGHSAGCPRDGSHRSHGRSSALCFTSVWFCTARYCRSFGQKLRLWPFSVGVGGCDRELVIGKGSSNVLQNVTSAVSCLHLGTEGTALLVLAGFPQALWFFVSSWNYWPWMVVFQYAFSHADCDMNPKGTKRGEATENSSSWIAMRRQNFWECRVRRGKGAKLWSCCLLFLGEGWSGPWCLPKICRCGWGTATGEMGGCFLSLIQS